MSQYLGQYPDAVDRALRIAMDAHAGQTDRYGKPYILHVLRVGLSSANPVESAAGFLHDVVEDSPGWTFERLKGEGFSSQVLRMVDCLTKRDGEEWDEYIARVMTDRGAMRIKLHDLEDNMNATRAPEFGVSESDRFQRYLRAWHRISDAMQNDQ